MSNEIPKLSQIKDAKLLKLLLAYAKKNHCDENVLFIIAVGKKESPEKLYKNFISANAKSSINISSKLRKAAEMLAGHIDMKTGQAVPPKLQKPDWKSPGWATVIDMAAQEVDSLFKSDVAPRFVKTQEYMDYAGIKPQMAKPQAGDITKICKILGIQDKDKLKAAMDARAVGKIKESEKLLAEIAKAEKLKLRDAEIEKALTQAGLL